MQQKTTSLLIILDGFGISASDKHNAISNAATPCWDEFWTKHPHTTLDASGTAVGLPDRQMGNSEVGHMHIGAGRTILQNFSLINAAVNNDSLLQQPHLAKSLEHLANTQHNLHLMGLLSPGGVHSHEQHLFALLKACAKYKLNKIYLHLFLDGRDTPPQSAKESFTKLESIIQQQTNVCIASISGRYFAMDRDNRWERVQPVYDLITSGISEYNFPDQETAIDYFYTTNTTDEFIPPCNINKYPGMQNGDSILFFNFRADRARELTAAFISDDFTGFQRDRTINNLDFLSMTEYSKDLKTKILFPPKILTATLGEVIAENNLTQLRIAETEKYAHVTFFLNGGREVKFTNEKRCLIPSPQVATYDLQPEMSAKILTEHMLKAIENQEFDVIICNFANPDMVGHTGNFAATVQAIEVIDNCLKQLAAALQKNGGQMLITADHGNAECMYDENKQQAHTAHTSELVPLVYVGQQKITFQTQPGTLSDIAPTFLQLIGITPPQEMTGTVLFSET